MKLLKEVEKLQQECNAKLLEKDFNSASGFLQDAVMKIRVANQNQDPNVFQSSSIVDEMTWINLNARSSIYDDIIASPKKRERKEIENEKVKIEISKSKKYYNTK